MDWSWLPAAAKDGAPWAIVAILVVTLFAALRSGRLRTDRECQDLIHVYDERLNDARETIADLRSLVRDQVEIDRKRQDVLDDLLEGMRTATSLIQALPPGRPTQGGRSSR